MLFTSPKPALVVYVSRLGKTIEFTDGRYETDDLHEIHALERNRYCVEGEQPQAQAEVEVDLGVGFAHCDTCESPHTCAQLGDCLVNEERPDGAAYGDSH